MSRPVIVINQKVIKSNIEEGHDEPPFDIALPGIKPWSAHEVIIRGQDGLPAVRLVYDPDLPLLCGCYVWVEVYEGATFDSFGSREAARSGKCIGCEEARRLREQRQRDAEIAGRL